MREALDARRWFSGIQTATEGGARVVSKLANQFGEGSDAFETFKDEAVEDRFSLNGFLCLFVWCVLSGHL